MGIGWTAAYWCGRWGGTVKCHTRQELAGWFDGFAARCRTVRA